MLNKFQTWSRSSSHSPHSRALCTCEFYFIISSNSICPVEFHLSCKSAFASEKYCDSFAVLKKEIMNFIQLLPAPVPLLCPTRSALCPSCLVDLRQLIRDVQKGRTENIEVWRVDQGGNCISKKLLPQSKRFCNLHKTNHFWRCRCTDKARFT